MKDYDNLIEKEAVVFDKQAEERINNGFIPDLRALKKVDWFYNNVWRDPEFVKIHWMPRISNIINHAKESGSKVLELGCGLGFISLELARNGLHVTGVDLSPQSIKVAEEYKNKNTHQTHFGFLEYICGDFHTMEFSQGEYDSVVFFRSLHHIPEWEKLIQKVYGILRPGGKLILSEPVRAHFTQESARFASVLRMVLPTWEDYGSKMNRPWDESAWNKFVEDIFQEYVFGDEHRQSPMDNSVDDADNIIKVIQRKFSVIEQKRSDAFVDKIIGGLRGEHKYEIAKFLRFLDEHMVAKGMLPPTSLDLVAVKEK